MCIMSFVSDCKYSVKIGCKLSGSWFPHIGVGQGRRLSPIFFNVGCISMPFSKKLGKSIVYADDGRTIISGETMEELNQKIVLACEDKTEWYHVACFVKNGHKSESVGINCQPNPISVAGHKVTNKSHIKFLGLGNIIPINKKGSKLNIDKYRPIILISSLGNILELVVIGDAMQHIDINLPTSIHGCRPNKNTESALCALLESKKSERNLKKKVAILVLDCSAAFDILDYELIYCLLNI